jgi:hypothetical protein
MQDAVAEQGHPESPGSDGASPYLRRGFPPRLRRHPMGRLIWSADAKRNASGANLEIRLRTVSAKQFLIEIEANLRFLRMSALVIALRTRLNF